MKCLCPYEDLTNEIASKYSFFTLKEAAAVASGYSPCCSYWRNDAIVRKTYADPCMEMDLWEQALRRAMEGGGLESVANCLDPAERLISRQALELWLEAQKGGEVSGNDKGNKEGPIPAATEITAQSKSDAMPTSSGQAWILKAREIGIQIANEPIIRNQEKIAKAVWKMMTQKHHNGEPDMTGRGEKVPSAESIRRHALKGLTGLHHGEDLTPDESP